MLGYFSKSYQKMGLLLMWLMMPMKKCLRPGSNYALFLRDLRMSYYTSLRMVSKPQQSITSTNCRHWVQYLAPSLPCLQIKWNSLLSKRVMLFLKLFIILKYTYRYILPLTTDEFRSNIDSTVVYNPVSSSNDLLSLLLGFF